VQDYKELEGWRRKEEREGRDDKARF